MASIDLITAFDEAPLNRRYWATLAIVAAGYAADFFDFIVVGFLVAVLGPTWHLTYLEAAVVLLSAGVGSVVGALCWGSVADSWGRKKAVVAGTLICGLSSVAIALIPEGAWMLFALLRFGVGFGLAGAITAQIALLVEYTPTRHRATLTSLPVILSTFGILAASATAASLLAAVGWRGVAVIGGAPVIVGILFALVAPESIRWLVARGRIDEARAMVASMTGRTDVATLAVPALPKAGQKITIASLFAYPGRVWLTVITSLGASTTNYGVYLWGPTIVAMLYAIPPKQAAGYFVYVALVGVVGKFMFSFLPSIIGRRHAGELHGYGAALALGCAAIFYGNTIAGVPAFIVFLVISALFFDGGFANLVPYSGEIFPVRLSARGIGVAQAANGAGKILGPLSMALIAGANNLVSPQATTEAVKPVFLFLAVSVLAVGLCFTFLGKETAGKPLALDETDDAVTGATVPR
jgi:putative MFS transporter